MRVLTANGDDLVTKLGGARERIRVSYVLART